MKDYRAWGSDLEPDAVRQMEIPYGLFERRIPLNGARFESGTHQLVNGCVVLRLTKLV